MEIAIGSVCDLAFSEVADITIPNRIQYCQRHGYKHFEKMDCSSTKHISFYRHEFYLQWIDECDWLWCLDVDAAIMNQSVKLEDRIVEGKDWVIGVDWIGMNAGSMLVRNCDWSKWLLGELIACEPEYRNHFHFDQGFLWQTIPRHADHVEVVEQRWFNSYQYEHYGMATNRCGQYRDGDFVLHLPGMKNCDRVAVFKKMLTDGSLSG